MSSHRLSFWDVGGPFPGPSPGGGTGRVGPPATRRRLCVLLQIGDKLVPGVEKFLLADDVVAVEEGAGAWLPAPRLPVVPPAVEAESGKS